MSEDNKMVPTNEIKMNPLERLKIKDFQRSLSSLDSVTLYTDNLLTGSQISLQLGSFPALNHLKNKEETSSFLDKDEEKDGEEKTSSKCPCIQKPEGKDAWFVGCIGALLAYMIAAEFGSFGLYYVEYTTYFDASKAAVGWIKGFQTLAGGTCSIFISPFIRIYGCKVVAVVAGMFLFLGMFAASFSPNLYVSYIFHGAVEGMGVNFGNICIQVIIMQHFTRNRVIGSGITYAGFTLGNFTSPLIVSYLLDHYGLRGCLLIHSAILAHFIPFGLLLRSPKNNKPMKEQSGKSISVQIRNELCDFTLLKDPLFICVLSTGVLFWYNVAGYMAHLPGRAIFFGISRSKAAYLHSIFACSSLAARIPSTFLANMESVNVLVYYGTACIFSAAGPLAYAFVTKYNAMIICPVLFGIGMGASTTVYIVAWAYVFGVEQLPRVLVLYNIGTSLGMALGPPLSGLMFDLTNNYDYPMILLGLTAAFTTILLFIVAFFDRKRKHKEAARTIEE